MKKQKRKNVGKARRIAAAGLAGCLLAGVSVQVNAATLKDLFDEHYYADTYGDLKEAYGYDREALWQHFVTFGLSEGRNMNGLLDVVKYRQEYADLDQAFGDNWDAYVDHFLLYGAKEGRDTGTDFDALDYAERYGDLKEAYGDDVLALWQHYQTYGAAEHREARGEQIVAAEKEAEAAQKAAESQKPADSQTPEENQGYEVREEAEDGSWSIKEYDVTGKLIKWTSYNADGSLIGIQEYGAYSHPIKMTHYREDRSWYTTEYNAAAECIKLTEYKANGNIDSMYEYVGGKEVKGTRYYASGSISDIHEYDENGFGIKSTHYKEDGNIEFTFVYENDAAGRHMKETCYNGDGKIHYIYERDVLGRIIKRTDYNEDESVKFIYVDEWNGDDAAGFVVKTTAYNAQGLLIAIFENDSPHHISKSTHYREDGSVNYVVEYSVSGNIEKITYFDASGNISRVTDADGNEIVEQKPGEGVDPGEDLSHTERVDNPNGGWVIKEYNAAGSEIKRTCYNEDGSYNSIFEYDGTEKQLALKHSYYNLDSPGSLEATLEWEYNDNGIKVKLIETGYNPGDRVRFRHIVDYDEAGNEIKDVTYNADGSVMSDFGFTERSYYKNEAGYVPSESFTSNGKGGFSCYYEYDEAGNLIKQRIHNADGTFTVREYDASGQAVRVTHYDADGNEIAG